MKNVLMIGQFTDISGYGNASRCYVRNLVELHSEKKINLKLLNFSFEKEIKISNEDFQLVKTFSLTDDLNIKRGQYNEKDINKIKKFTEQKYEVIFFLLNDWMSVEAGINLKKICTQSQAVYRCVVWETNSIPDIWRDVYKSVPIKTMICACDWNKQTFSEIAPCEVVPYSVDFEEQYDKQYHDKLKNIIQDKFVVSTVFQRSLRKGIEKTLLAFYLAFYDNPNAILIMKTYKNKTMGAPNETNFLSSEVRKIISKIKHKGKNIEPKCKTIILNDILSKKQINSIYKLSDVYLSCSRGEGFGLPLAEAINFEVPVLAPDIGGHLDFIDPSNNFLIKSSMEPVLEFQNSYWSSIDNEWVEVSLKSAKDKLLESYKDQDLKQKGKASKKYMLQTLSKKACKEKLKMVLE